MELIPLRHLWGVDLAAGLGRYAERWREIGYRGVEVPLPVVPDRAEMFRTLEAQGWTWVAQVLTACDDDDGRLGPIRSRRVEDHVASLRRQLDEAVPLRPLFVSAHSGCDTWSAGEAEAFFGASLDVQKEYGVVIAHETHRQRYLATPWATEEMLRRFPTLELTCDFSHWVCVCERLLPDLGDVLARAARHARHVHARVGHEQGPQVSDPRAPEFAPHLAAHEQWWSLVWQAQRERRLAHSTLTPEFGPLPYLPTEPFTQRPLADLAEICDWMTKRQAHRFKYQPGTPP